MPSHQYGPPLPVVVPERDSHVARCFAEHVESLGLSAVGKRELIGAARHVAIWLAVNGLGLDRFDIRLLDHFMRHECRCPGRNLAGTRLGTRYRRLAARFLRYQLETGWAEMPSEIEAGGHLAAQFLESLEERRYARSTIQKTEKLYRHFIVWLHLSGTPLATADERVRRRFLTHD